MTRDGEELTTTTVLLIDQRNSTYAEQFYAIQQTVKVLAAFRTGDGITV
jgi:hypothetical protein